MGDLAGTTLLATARPPEVSPEAPLAVDVPEFVGKVRFFNGPAVRKPPGPERCAAFAQNASKAALAEKLNPHRTPEVKCADGCSLCCTRWCRRPDQTLRGNTVSWRDDLPMPVRRPYLCQFIHLDRSGRFCVLRTLHRILSAGADGVDCRRLGWPRRSGLQCASKRRCGRLEGA